MEKQPMTYTLYYREGSGSMVTEAALALCGVAYERVAVPKTGMQSSPAFLKLNPAGKIPVLQLPDGQPLAETLAQILTLDERHTAAGLLPKAPADRARALQWLAFLASSTYEAALRVYYPDRYLASADAAMIEAVRVAAERHLNRDLDLVEAAMATPFFFGATMTMVDVYAAMMADWTPGGMERPRFKALRSALLQHEGVRRAWTGHDYAV
jgi:glutathione S-transferase